MLTHTEAAAAIKTFDTEVIEMLLDLAHIDRLNLVNQYTGADRSERINRNAEVTAVLEEELAARRGLVSSADILAALAASPDFVAVQDSAHLAYLLDLDEAEKMPLRENLTLSIDEARALPCPADDSYTVGQRIILINLPHVGATVRSLDEAGVGIDYDNDEPGEDYEAMYAHIRPMPLH